MFHPFQLLHQYNTCTRVEEGGRGRGRGRGRGGGEGGGEGERRCGNARVEASIYLTSFIFLDINAGGGVVDILICP